MEENMKLRSLVCLVMVFLTPMLFAQRTPGGGAPGGVSASVDTSWIKTKYQDLTYASKSSTQKLDLYLPNEGTGPFPLIIEIHGGAFMMGSKSSMVGPILDAVKRGYAVASINYRLSGEALFPAAIHDVKAAIRFLRANATQYKLNAVKFATWGGSAGGNLSALAGTSGGVAALTDPSLGNPSISDAVQAAVDWYGPILFSTMDAEFKALGQTPAMGSTSAATSPESKYIGKTVGGTEAASLVAQASPQTYIDAKDPPFYIQHGTADRNIPITQSKNFATRLTQALGANKVVYETLEGAGHGGTQFDAADNISKILDFLDRYLK